jgi:pyruvate dehydrogenase E2 component (dihydrolipoyllysine-residue acetyltransferase)
MTDVIMPQMGESIAEGTVTKWMKNVGDKVQRDEPLFEISTDKVDAEIPAPASGILKEIRVQPGATVPINTVVGVIAGEGEAVAAAPAASAAPPAAPATPAAAPPASPAVSARPPAPASAAPASSQADGAAESASRPAPSPPAPAVPREPPRPAPVAAPTPVVPVVPPRPTWSPTPPPPSAPAAPARADSPSAPASAVPADQPSRTDMTLDELRQTRSSPVVRKIAAEHNLDIRDIPGTGIAGRVTKQDILTHMESKPAETPAPAPRPTPAPAPVAATPQRPPSAPSSPAPPAAPAPQAAAAPASPPPVAPSASSRVEVVPMSPIRKKTAEHMVLSKRISAHVTTVFEIDMTRVDQLRQKYAPAYQERSAVKLTYMPFIIKATVDALKAFPVLNASVEGDAVVYRHDINIGIAVALDWGLIVPVIRNADEKNVLGLARAVNDLAERARTKRLKVEEVQGGTFTITNPGVFGSLFGTPIINQPQVAILGTGVIEKRTIVRDDAIAIRTMAYFALSFDHRIVDGSDADRFMAHMKKGLQEFDETAL